MKARLFLVLFGLACVTILSADEPTVAKPAPDPKPASRDERYIGLWYGEHIYLEKGLSTQWLMERKTDGAFFIHHRGKRYDLPGRLLDFSMRGTWGIQDRAYTNHLTEFQIHEANVTPSSAKLDFLDEYEVISSEPDLLAFKSKSEGVVFHSRRVTPDFELPELPKPPKGTQPAPADETPFSAYLR